MTEHDSERPEIEAQGEEDVEAHGLKEAAVAGMSAAALIAGAGNAAAANAPEAKTPDAKHAIYKGAAVDKLVADPTLKIEAVNKLQAGDATIKIGKKAASIKGTAVVKLTDQS
jgi:hypothetical protein